MWVVGKGKDGGEVLEGGKMEGMRWDDGEKVGEVGVEKNSGDVGVGGGCCEMEVKGEW